MENRKMTAKRKRAIVIFGATGDLALRMLFPSLYFLELDGLLTHDLTVVGSARTELTDEAFAKRIEETIRLRAGPDYDEAAWQRLHKRLR